jgi:hypothetical protein
VVPPVLVLTGKILGAEESHVTELVTSLTVGEVEYVPIARKFPVSCKFPTVIVLGIMVSESKVAPPVPPPPLVTVIVAVAPVDPAMLAEIVAVPMDTAVDNPDELTVATAGVLEVQITWLVTS